MKSQPSYLATRGMQKQVLLPVLLDAVLVFDAPFTAPAGVAAVLAWGRKPSAAAAERRAMRLGLPLLRVEDGFVRSVEPAPADASQSAVLDDMGIYYDATGPSRLEQLAQRPLTDGQRQRADSLMRLWRKHAVSKYNHAPDPAPPGRPYVLLVDQTRGDASIHFGLAGAHSFQDMLAAALAEHPDCEVLIKVHPEVMRGAKEGHMGTTTLRDPRIRILGEDVHPVVLIRHARAVYAVCSQLGFEALLWGVPVRTFGMPFYAGWGLTHDTLPAPARRKPVALEALVHAALVDYARYVHPETGQRCPPEALIEWLGLQRRHRHRYPGPMYACGFSRWKRPIVRAYLQGSDVRFVRRPSRAAPGSLRVLWGRRESDGRGPELRLEDGFLRSVGLGADLVRPLSWVLDDTGIYYDASVPSALENLLLHLQLDAAGLERARYLHQRILDTALTKYNVGAGQWSRPNAHHVILVPGQVESDLSIRYGAGAIRSNLELVRAARLANPDAWLIYKPHPDVRAGLRACGVGEEQVAAWCDEVVGDVPMGQLLTQVDEVHVLTSLTGFEALLRGRKVVCYGTPFYAGWGLTRDMEQGAPALQRRDRILSLEELLAGTLIEYPSYISRITGRYTTPEQALVELQQWQAGPASSRWRQRLVRVLARLKG